MLWCYGVRENIPGSHGPIAEGSKDDVKQGHQYIYAVMEIRNMVLAEGGTRLWGRLRGEKSPGCTASGLHPSIQRTF